VYSIVVAIVVIDFVALFAQYHSDAKHDSSSHLSRFMFKVGLEASNPRLHAWRPHAYRPFSPHRSLRGRGCRL